MNTRQKHALSLLQASQANPTLARLITLQRDAEQRMQAILPLIPEPLREFVHHGPLEDGGWSLLLSNNTCAAKLRQLIPAFEACLRVKGLPVTAIRLKVSRKK